MTELKKKRIKAVLKYTWPVYLVAGVVIGFGLNFIFGITHRIPAYKTLTLFVSGEVEDPKGLEEEIVGKYKDNELKSFSCISANPQDSNYNAKLTVPGYNTADILIIPLSKLDSVNVGAFALELSKELISEYCSNYTFYEQENVKYGVEINRELTSKYFTLPNETCYMLANGNSKNTGKYSTEAVKQHDNALRLLRDWGR